MAKRQEGLGVGMWLVIVSKALTGVLLLAAFVLLVFAGSHDPTDVFSKMVTALFKGSPPGIAINFVVDKTASLSPGKAFSLAAATLAYGILEGTEAVGLATRQRWAEWLTIIVTASFLPFEVFELVKEPTALKAATLVMNVVILIFLIVRRGKERRRPGRTPARMRLART